MKEHRSAATICLRANIGLEYAICKIEYRINEEGDFSYTFTPNFSVIALLSDRDFQGIPGLNLDLKRSEYHRDNLLPTFISERVPQPNRADYSELLRRFDMKYMEPLEYLIKAGDAYSGDNLYLVPYLQKKRVVLEELLSKSNTFMMLRLAMTHIASGDDILIGNTEVNDSNRKEVHDLLLPFYLKAAKSHKEALEKSAKAKPVLGRGRPRKPISGPEFLEIDKAVRNKRLTIEEASRKLGISVSSYHRYRKRFE